MIAETDDWRTVVLEAIARTSRTTIVAGHEAVTDILARRTTREARSWLARVLQWIARHRHRTFDRRQLTIFCAG